ncbi:MAG: hypothetical protein NZO16_03315 [Deltaproteobacteria bacterium]|nr:hypothetical protein [Deltaproteobacteria bacterium]
MNLGAREEKHESREGGRRPKHVVSAHPKPRLRGNFDIHIPSNVPGVGVFGTCYHQILRNL